MRKTGWKQDSTPNFVSEYAAMKKPGARRAYQVT
jgi:hypothetical protein